MVNFLALLGWSPGSGDQEVFTRDELVARFTLEGISGGNAVFNPEKLDWFNQQHIMRMPARRSSRASAAGSRRPPACWRARSARPARTGSRGDRSRQAARAEARRHRPAAAAVSSTIASSAIPAAVAKHLSAPDLGPHLAAWRDALARRRRRSTPPTLESALRALAEERGIKAGVLIHATRVAVTGQAVSPGIFEVLELVGRDRVLNRLS